MKRLPFLILRRIFCTAANGRRLWSPYISRHFSRENLPSTGLKTVFTIHNIEYQGKFDGGILHDLLGISEADRGILENDGAVNYMKGAIVTCDRLTTVRQKLCGGDHISLLRKGA